MAADINLKFNTAQAMNGTDTSVLSTDWIKGLAGQDWGAGDAPVLEVITTTDGAGAGTVRFEVGAVLADGTGFIALAATMPLDPTTLDAPVVGVGTLNTMKGTRKLLRLSPLDVVPPNANPLLTDLRMRAVFVGAVTGLAVSSQLVPAEVMTQAPNHAYPAGY